MMIMTFLIGSFMNLKATDLKRLQMAMIKKFGRTNYSGLAKELGVSRNAIYRAKANEQGFDKLREKMKEWAKW